MPEEKPPEENLPQDSPESNSKKPSLKEKYDKLPAEIKDKVKHGRAGSIRVTFDPVIEFLPSYQHLLDEFSSSMLSDIAAQWSSSTGIARGKFEQANAILKKNRGCILEGLQGNKKETFEKAWEYHKKLAIAVKFVHQDAALSITGGNIRFTDSP